MASGLPWALLHSSQRKRVVMRGVKEIHSWLAWGPTRVSACPLSTRGLRPPRETESGLGSSTGGRKRRFQTQAWVYGFLSPAGLQKG